MADVSMPRLSDSMEEGTILKWLVSDGDTVSKGDEIAEIETDKSNMTFEADQSGTLEIVAQEGDTLAVGETIARIGEGGGSDDDDGGDEEEDEPDDEAPDEPEPEPEPDEEEEDEAPAAGDGRVKASPIARRMARDMGLDLADVKGSGPGGRIVKADVEAAGGGEEAEPEEESNEAPGDEEEGTDETPADDEDEAPEDEAPEDEGTEEPPEAKPSGRDAPSGRGDAEHVELTRLQRTVARRMAESKATAPDFVMTLEVDMEEAVEFRKELKAAAGGGAAPSFNDFVVKASALALRDFPRANGAYRDGAFELYSRINIGVAVAGQDALVVPTVFDADRKSLGAIAAEARRLAERVRAGEITPPELSAGTFTISNLGMYGIKRFTAVINPPQAAILAVGELSPRPVVRDGELAIRSVMELTLSCDHRILYGADAAAFLARIREYLETPLKLAL